MNVLHTVRYVIPPPDDDFALTPAQERAVLKRLNEMIDREMTKVLFGGHPQPFHAVPNAAPAPPRNRKYPFGIIQFEDVG